MIRRYILAGLFLGHGLAHTLPGMRSTEGVARWIAGEPALQVSLLRWAFTLLWSGAVIGLLAAGFGVLGVSTFRARWRPWALVGVTASLFLLIAGWRTPLAAVGVLVDLGLLVPTARATSWPVAGRRGKVAAVLATAIVASIGALVLVRPWYVRWGSTTDELRATLPGDEFAPEASYQIQHAITIPAPAEVVWPWLVQLGEDRGGFYSYAWLENLFGLHIRNTERIHPEWQQLRVGDTVFATHRGWLGLNRRMGWRVARLDPGRALVLQGWGAFVLEPIDSTRTRLIIRTRGSGADNIVGLLLSPVGLLGFEPAHFVMQRKMLLTLRDRATGPPA